MSHSIILVAPVPPFRGGIARHSGCLARAFACRDDVRLEVASFSRLYPRFLYPGSDDRDAAALPDSAFETRFCLDTINPLTWGEFAARLRERPPSLVVIPAWTFFTAPCLGWIARAARKAGHTVVMVVHNVGDHEAKGWKSRLSNWQLSAADGFMTHGDNLAAQLRSSHHLQPAKIIAHPAYSDFPAPDETATARRADLELLCFGLVRNYKGVDLALKGLAKSGLGSVKLTVAGEIWEGRDELFKLAQQPELAGKVEFLDRYVSDQEAADLFCRADAILAPYRSVTGSGVAAMAAHYNRPLVASDLPGLSELIDHGETGWLFPAGNVEVLAELLAHSVNRQLATRMSQAIARRRPEDGWAEFADGLISFAEALPR